MTVHLGGGLLNLKNTQNIRTPLSEVLLADAYNTILFTAAYCLLIYLLLFPLFTISLMQGCNLLSTFTVAFRLWIGAYNALPWYLWLYPYLRFGSQWYGHIGSVPENGLCSTAMSQPRPFLVASEQLLQYKKGTAFTCSPCYFHCISSEAKTFLYVC